MALEVLLNKIFLLLLFGRFPQIYLTMMLEEKLACITSIKNGCVKTKKSNTLHRLQVIIIADVKTVAHFRLRLWIIDRIFLRESSNFEFLG